MTIRDVAREAGVSKTTVAHVLRSTPSYRVHEGTRARVLAAADRLGYRRNALAAALSSGRLDTIGVVIPWEYAGASGSSVSIYFKDMVVAVAAAAAEAGLRITLVPFRVARDGEAPTTARDVADQRVDGLISVSLHAPDFLHAVYEADIPLVEIGTTVGSRSVRPDNAGGASHAVTHLVRLGHRRIAHYQGSGGPNNATARKRADGFRAACNTHGLPENETPILEDLGAVRDALALPPALRPTGLFAFNDNQAAEVYDAARQAGLSVPGDLSVIGFDDNTVAETLRPALTTVHNPLRAQAEAAVRLLKNCWHDPATGETDKLALDNGVVVVPTRLVERSSTGPAP